ncbi:Serpin family [Trema orientale]|uniref:Serpin family n=1 Tax=Trema orientale TaxID=63057 RepID=A0A2P5E7P6_TREOI|nr:Serpin family [Trema orientale]
MAMGMGMDFCTRAATQLILDEIKKDDGTSKNVVMSPLSINMMLNMVASGSGGQTLEQFLKVLGSKDITDLNDESFSIMSLLASVPSSSNAGPDSTSSSDTGSDSDTQEPEEHQPPVFSLANALWVDHGFQLLPSFREITESIYKAQVKNADLVNEAEQVKKDVNSWVENETKGLIKDILSPDDDFHLLNGETIRVPFMTSRNVYHSYALFEDFEVLKLPYQRGQCIDNQFSVYFLLPHQKNGLQEMMETLNSDTTKLQPKLFHLPEEKLSKVWLPKLKFSYDVDLIELMRDKGLTLPFDPTGSDFTNMVYLPPRAAPIYISMFLHKSHIEVNEEGTEAAAATFAGTLLRCARRYKNPPLPSFVADHPFMFMIVEEHSKRVIFCGVLLDPKARENE